MSSKYPLFGLDIELSDDSRTATVSKGDQVLKTFTTKHPSVLVCLEKGEPTPQIQAQRFAKSYKAEPPKQEPPAKTEEPKT